MRTFHPNPSPRATTVETARLQSSPSSFLSVLEREVERLGMGASGVLVGVSGGADSVALLRGLKALAESQELRLVAAHLNHGMRAHAASQDAEWTAALCERLGIPIVVEAADVPALARGRRLNDEEAARTVRYEFFKRAASEARCAHVAVAHTADDQVETVLHHLLRGTSLAGLRGMHASRLFAEGVTLVRPLLTIRRARIEAWLAEIGQDFRTDATNADQSRTRSRLRHSVLPALEREMGPQVRESILRLAEQASELQSTIEELAKSLLKKCLEDDGSEVVRLNTDVLADARRHLVREVFVELWKAKKWPRQAMGFDDWDRLARLVKDGGAVTLPGDIAARRRGKLIVLCGRAFRNSH
jgi:tRNA(Ile)-lysidine synthase